MTTLGDIAQRLDLSPATVSRCLNGHPDMSPATRAAVLQAAAAMGYVRRGGRTTAAKKASTQPEPKRLSVVLRHRHTPGQPMLPVMSRVLAGMASQAEASDCRLQLRHATFHDPNDPFEVDAYREPSVAGYLFMGWYDPDSIRELAASSPCFLIAHHDCDGRADSVDHDNLQGVAMLMRHLADRGHTRVALVGDGDKHGPYRERLAGYLIEQARHGGPDLSLTINATGPVLSKQEIANRLVALKQEGVTAAVCVNDHLAYSVMTVLQETHGLVVPDDFSLVGFDALEPRAGFATLTSIDSPFEEMGAVAIRRLLQRCHTPEIRPARLMLSCSLREGASVRHLA